jgi:subtilisin family serine protease
MARKAVSIVGLSLSALLLLGACASQGTRGEKIGGEIHRHRLLKERPPERSVEEHRKRLDRMGLKAPDTEACALYVAQRLTDEEIRLLGKRGIVVNRDVWVPPVERRHPFGFHIARVAYTSLDALEDDDRFVRVRSLERRLRPTGTTAWNDLARKRLNVDAVHAGEGVTKRTGAGIKVAIADSGLDLTHADIPTPVEAFDVTDGEDVDSWGTDVTNTVSPHGTHVTGTLCGSGVLSGGTYRGTAPGVSLYFYKIANDTDGLATEEDVIKAIERAQSQGCRIFSMSFGGWSFFNDGSDPMEQAADAALAEGMLCFFAAGNEGYAYTHVYAPFGSRRFLTNVIPGSWPPAASFSYKVVGEDQLGFDHPEVIQVIWRDESSADAELQLTCENLGEGESLEVIEEGVSPRGTKAKHYELVTSFPQRGEKTYQLTLTNEPEGKKGWQAPKPFYGSWTPRAEAHCFGDGVGTFMDGEPSSTIASPALADLAVAVGAVIQRKQWIKITGGSFTVVSLENSLDPGTVAPFTSRGPRIDGFAKPDVAAPGAWAISCRDSGTFEDFPDVRFLIDNDGENLDGSGPADYYVSAGTSMACPAAAGVAALMLESNPNLTPGQIVALFRLFGSTASAPDQVRGHGEIDALKAVKTAELLIGL